MIRKKKKHLSKKKLKKDVFVSKTLKYTKEKRLSEFFYIRNKDQILIRHLVKSFIRNSFFYKKKQIKERLIYKFEQWKKQFYHFTKLNKSKTIQNSLQVIRRNEGVEVLVLKHYFLKGILIEKELSLKRYPGMIRRIRKRNRITSSVTLQQRCGRHTVEHRFQPYSSNILGVIEFRIGLNS